MSVPANLIIGQVVRIYNHWSTQALIYLTVFTLATATALILDVRFGVRMSAVIFWVAILSIVLIFVVPVFYVAAGRRLFHDFFSTPALMHRRGTLASSRENENRRSSHRPDRPLHGDSLRWFGRRNISIASILGLGILTLALTTYAAINHWSAVVGPNLGWLITIAIFIQIGIIVTVVLSSGKSPSWLGEEVQDYDRSKGEFPRGSEKSNNLIDACGYGDQSLSRWKQAKRIAVKVEDQYRVLWKCLWICWLQLYIVFAIKNVASLLTSPDNVNHDSLMFVLTVSGTFFNNCATIVILLIYFVLSKPTVGISENQSNQLQTDVVRWFAVVVVLTLVETFALAIAHGYFSNVSDTEAIQRFRQVEFIFDWISGIGSATAMAMYVGRLDSKYLSTPTWVLVMLYFYASIQPLYALIGRNPLGTLVLINAALMLKCAWFLYSEWLFQSGRLAFYFIRIRRVYQEINEDWSNFSLAIQEKKVS